MFLGAYGKTKLSSRTAETALKTAVKAANKELGAKGMEPITSSLTPHSLRRLYASLRFGVGDDIVYVSEQLGHTSPIFSMEKYAKAIRRRERLTGDYAEQFDQAMDWSRLGTESQTEGLADPAKPLAERADADPFV